MLPPNDHGWCPFRPTSADLTRIEGDVSDIPDIQQEALAKNAQLHFPDRVAHQYQIAGGKVVFAVAADLQMPLLGIGLFQPGATHIGLGRISTGLGTPHVETQPDFLGIMVAFLTSDGRRVDFLGINDPASPANNHRDFMDILRATGDAAGAEIPFVGGAGNRDLLNLAAQQTIFGAALARRLGPIKALETLAHLTRQTVPTAFSSTAYQTYWTGIVELAGTAGKFTFVPSQDENRVTGLSPAERHLSEDWQARQTRGDIEFQLYWIPFLDEARTPSNALTEKWEQSGKIFVGTIVFPRSSAVTEDAMLPSILVSEMGANPGNWIADKDGSVGEPSTEFGNARKIAYGKSQAGREALDPASYESFFRTGQIDPDLATELWKRRERKRRAGHINQAP